MSFQEYNETPKQRTSGESVDQIETDITGNQKVTQATALAGEDLANDVMKVEQRFSGLHMTSDQLVKSGLGFVHSITFACVDAAPTAGTIIVYDNTAESGTILFSHTFTTTPFLPVTIVLDMTYTVGLYVGFTTTADVGVSVSYR